MAALRSQQKGVLKDVPQTWTDIVLIYKFANQTTTPLLVGKCSGIFSVFSPSRFQRHCRQNYGFVLPWKIAPW